MTQEELFNQFNADMAKIASNHHAEYIGKKVEDFQWDSPEMCFIILECNVPTIADVNMLAEAYNIPRLAIDINNSWGYVSVVVTPRFLFTREVLDKWELEDEKGWLDAYTFTFTEPDTVKREMSGALNG